METLVILFIIIIIFASLKNGMNTRKGDEVYKRDNIEDLRKVLSDKISDYEKQYKDFSRMELIANINKIYRDNIKLWSNICTQANEKQNCNWYDFHKYNLNGQCDLENSVDIYALDEELEEEIRMSNLYDREYMASDFLCDLQIAKEISPEEIAKYRSLVNLYRRIRPLTYNEEGLIFEEEKRQRKDFEKLEHNERPDLVLCTQSRLKKLTEDPVINFNIYILFKSIREKDFKLFESAIFNLKEYKGISTYALNYIIYEKSNDREYYIMLEKLFLFFDIEFDELDLNFLVSNYTEDNDVYKLIIKQMLDKNKEKFRAQIIFSIHYCIDNNIDIDLFLEYAFNSLDMKSAILSNIKGTEIFNLCINRKLNVLKMLLSTSNKDILDDEAIFVADILKPITQENVIKNKSGKITYNVSTIKMRFYDAIINSNVIKKSIKNYIIKIYTEKTIKC